jgi:hypothetical protein
MQAESKPVEPTPFPDGVVSPDFRTAFVTSPQGGIQAVRLDDGKILWTNDECKAQPWLVVGKRLVARGERLFVLSLNGGNTETQCDAPPYPKVAVPDRCTVSFQMWGPRVDGDILEARWFAVANIDRSKGRPFPFQAWTAFNKEAPAGTLKVDLGTGKVTIQPDAQPTDVTSGLMPEAAKPERRMPPGLPANLLTEWQEYHKGQDGRVCVHDRRLVGVAMTLEKAGNEYLKIITLHTWNLKSGEAADPVELVKDKALNIANVVITEDRRHAAVVFGTSALTIYSLADGKLIAKDVKGVSSPNLAFVDGKRLYFTQLAGGRAAKTPNTLKALDLESRQEVWQIPLKPKSTLPLPP